MKPLVFRVPPRVHPVSDEHMRVRLDPAQLLLFDRTSEMRVPLSGPVMLEDDRLVAG